MEVPQQDARHNNMLDRVTTPENCAHVHTTQPHATPKPQEVTEINCTEIKLDHEGSSESLTDIIITSEDALLLPDHIPTISRRIEREKSSLPNGSTPSVPNGSAVVCTPPAGRTKAPAAIPQKCNGHKHLQKKHLTSTSKSQQSFKCDASEIKKVAGDDCCAHCILACLFCEPLSVCSALDQCLACGLECDAVCCCGETAIGGFTCCAEDSCSALLDCGMLEDCCQSSDCLEICLECCSICFPT